MSLEEKMNGVVRAYVAAVNAGDADGAAALYAADASVEDPVGSDPKVGHEQIAEFYHSAFDPFEMKCELAWSRVVADTAIFEIIVEATLDNTTFRARPIDIMRFNKSGDIISMRAVFSDDNLETLTHE